MSFMPDTTDRQLALRLKKLRTEAAQQRSIEILQSSLDQAASECNESHDSYAQQSLNLFIRNNEGDSLLPLIAHLLQTTNAALDSAFRYISYQSASISLFDLLFEHGWNVNQPDETDNGRRVLALMITNEDYVRWLLDHGAQVHHRNPEPILDLCARVGSLATFKLLQDKGAKISGRTLHCAAQAAASCGADPIEAQAGVLSETVTNRVELLRYLVEDCKLDINMPEDEIGYSVDCFGHWGTPLCYAASEHRGARVVQWLLQEGADPRAGKSNGSFNALWVAKLQGNVEVLATLEKWRGPEIRNVEIPS